MKGFFARKEERRKEGEMPIVCQSKTEYKTDSDETLLHNCPL